MSLRSLSVAALTVCTSAAWLVGCGQTDSTGSADQHATEVTASHAQQLATCKAEHDAALDVADSQMQMTQTVLDYADCLAEANDAVVPQLERNLTEIESYLVGETVARFDAQRASAAGACTVIVDASDSVGGSIAGLYRADCLASLELGLGGLLGSYAWLGSEATPLDDGKARAQFAACYAPYDQALDAADSQNAMTQATFGLATCIEDTIKASARSDAGLVGLTVQNFPERSATEIQATIEAGLDAAFAANGATCELLTEAGENGGGSLARMLAGSCRADAAWFVHEQIAVTVGE